MRSLIFGGTGLLGRPLVEELRSRGWPTLALSHGQADIRDEDRLAAWMARFRPEVVFNCAAFTRVDACEERSDHAMEVNGEAVGIVARRTAEAGARLIQVSTDYVFDGRKKRPYREDDPPGPLSAYGRSKLVGETRALEQPGSLVVRTSWLFGPHGPSFVTTMVRLVEEGKTPLRVVDDQTGAPTYTPFLARALGDLAAAGSSGIVHYRNREPATWWEFAREIVVEHEPSVEVVPVTTDEFPRPAPRPGYSVLDTGRFEELIGRGVEPWSGGLTEVLRRLERGPGPG